MEKGLSETTLTIEHRDSVAKPVDRTAIESVLRAADFSPRGRSRRKHIAFLNGRAKMLAAVGLVVASMLSSRLLLPQRWSNAAAGICRRQEVSVPGIFKNDALHGTNRREPRPF
ncbi:MAG: hypothetical protein ABII12_06545 [Planctomycetota bacterium]